MLNVVYALCSIQDNNELNSSSLNLGQSVECFPRVSESVTGSHQTIWVRSRGGMVTGSLHLNCCTLTPHRHHPASAVTALCSRPSVGPLHSHLHNILCWIVTKCWCGGAFVKLDQISAADCNTTLHDSEIKSHYKHWQLLENPLNPGIWKHLCKWPILQFFQDSVDSSV